MLTLRRCGGHAVTSWPSSRIARLSGSSKPAIIRSVVVLPQPDGPSRVKNSPAAIGEVGVLRPPRSEPNRLTTCSRVMTGSRAPFRPAWRRQATRLWWKGRREACSENVHPPRGVDNYRPALLNLRTLFPKERISTRWSSEGPPQDSDPMTTSVAAGERAMSDRLLGRAQEIGQAEMTRLRPARRSRRSCTSGRPGPCRSASCRRSRRCSRTRST